jgi:hypothetical protein
MAGVEVHPVPEGSIVVLRDLDGGSHDAGRELAEVLQEVVGHSSFVVLSVTDSTTVEVLGPDVDVRARLMELLREAGVEPEPQAITGVATVQEASTLPTTGLRATSVACLTPDRPCTSDACPLHGKRRIATDGDS